MEEQRKYRRYTVEGQIIIKLKSDMSRTIRGELVDICALGVGAYAQENLPVGAEADFILINKFLEKSLIGIGKIKYSLALEKDGKQLFRIGVEFTKVDGTIIQRIIDGVQKGVSSNDKT
ncbi:MAG: hypothetical protein WDL87_01380 [Candidatus Omnitrophota bacterium]|jgi:c-di-GMP-binding flagellar brake protein YcgR